MFSYLAGKNWLENKTPLFAVFLTLISYYLLFINFNKYYALFFFSIVIFFIFKLYRQNNFLIFIILFFTIIPSADTELESLKIPVTKTIYFALFLSWLFYNWIIKISRNPLTQLINFKFKLIPILIFLLFIIGFVKGIQSNPIEFVIEEIILLSFILASFKGTL